MGSRGIANVDRPPAHNTRPDGGEVIRSDPIPRCLVGPIGIRGATVDDDARLPVVAVHRARQRVAGVDHTRHAKQSQTARDGGRLFAQLSGGRCSFAEQQRAQVAVAKALQGELAAGDSRQELGIFRTEGVQRTLR